MFSSKQSQTGVALISVLLIVAVLLAVTSRLLSAHHIVISQHQNTFEQNQALQYALGAETLAKQALYQDFNISGKDVDHAGEVWAQQTMPFELDEGGYLEAQLVDLHGCLNLNSVIGSDPAVALERLQQLMQNLGMPNQFANTWKDWIDDDAQIDGFGAEDSEYLIASPAYRTPNQLVLDVSELYLLQNVEREHIDTLLKHTCLLPQVDSKINVNTANAQTLAALDKDISLAVVEPIVTAERSYASVNDFVQAFPSFLPAESALAVTSDHFLLHAQAQVGDSSVTLQSVMYRDPDSGVVTVLRRDFGKLFRSNLAIETEES